MDAIEAEISSHEDYVRQFQGKVVLCNCDDPEWSNFYKFFRQHFKQLGLKKLITAHYNMDGSPSYKLEWDGSRLGDNTVNMVKTPLDGDGDFQSDECIELLKEADIVVTNPPYQLRIFKGGFYMGNFLINFKVRAKNQIFWITLIPAVLLAVQYIAGLFGFELNCKSRIRCSCNSWCGS